MQRKEQAMTRNTSIRSITFFAAQASVWLSDNAFRILCRPLRAAFPTIIG